MRIWFVRLGFLSLSTVIAIGLAELALRMSGAGPPPGLFTVTESEFQRIPGIFGPDQRVELNPGTRFAHTVTIDSLGFRGANIPREKPTGELRVLFAGDSFTWGHNVSDDETLPAQLESRLKDACGAGRVVNAGLSGSTILAQEAMILRGLGLEPDVVALMFHENDIRELAYIRIWDQLARNRSTKSRFPVGVVYPILRRSQWWNLAQDVRRGWGVEAMPDEEAPTVASNASAEILAARGEYSERLESVASMLDARGVRLIFIAFPHPDSVRSGEGGPHYQWVLDTARGMAVETVDILELMMRSGVEVERAFLVPEDYHPSPFGHELAAGWLAEVVLDGWSTSHCRRQPQ